MEDRSTALGGPGVAVVDTAPVLARPLTPALPVPEVSVVVPMLNERPTIRELTAELTAALDDLGRPWEVVFVDDGSTDGTFGELMEVAAGDDRLRVVKLRRNFGKATALAAGFEQAVGDFVVTMDSDLQDDPREIRRLLAVLDDGHDVA
jgi:glycosyltransferase involved in cell wall biosynthesis